MQANATTEAPGPSLTGAEPARSQRAVTPTVGLTRGRRRALLVVHVLASGAWIGIDVIVAVLVGTGWFAADTGLRGLAYRALANFVVWPMLVSGLLCLLTGLLLGLGTKWGLLRYWWVAVKLALNVALCTLILVVLQPGMADVDAYGQDLLAGAGTDDAIVRLFFPPAVSLTCLGLATTLAIVKPWGRTRTAGRAQANRAEPHSSRPAGTPDRPRSRSAS